MTKVLELPGNDFKEAMIKMFQWAFVNMHETKEKNRKPQQRNRRYKEELNWNFRSEKHNNQRFKA